MADQWLDDLGRKQGSALAAAFGKLGIVTRPDQSRRSDAIATMAAHGITVTEEGLARARAKLDDAAAKWTPERRRALREQLGLPVEPA